MADIKIPREVLEAAAKAICALIGSSWIFDGDPRHSEAREDMVALAKAAFDAGLAAWPGANIDRLTAEVERLRAALIHARNQIQHPDQLIDEALEPRT